MIIAGAGGHALEVLDILRFTEYLNPAVYGEDISPFWPSELPALNRLDQVEDWLSSDRNFVLGVGSPKFRKKLYQEFTQRGGVLHALRGPQAVISSTASTSGADILTSAFVGAQVTLGLGVLVNVGAQVHHEARVGEFSVINPGAVLLGACELGSECFIGANATILPGVRIGEGTIIGAGAVIIRDVPSGVTVVGVPGRIV
ncbi:UDP-N-acetylbacillosamine N-acetyltransferase [Algoriphagus aquaeductus]|uniref:UDP-N-acetylbacillosamine N-acetyltransferase n=1 Tax=Algoriphagus aquaeductus TaxID=475299 RepID=A0A326RRQ9_9BACT|nr:MULTISPECIES: NeuD/PglB/VioB family sugar acetyltransferase [Algoriphagus]PZV76692.1 UDP-N-acetylbacillosamine N-acetyltransferase [Algoriphagus aquaeductus]